MNPAGDEVAAQNHQSLKSNFPLNVITEEELYLETVEFSERNTSTELPQQPTTYMGSFTAASWLFNTLQSGGILIDTKSQKAATTSHIILKVQETASRLLRAQKASVKCWQVLLGLLESLVDVVPQCIQHMRILQIHLRKYLCPSSQAIKTTAPNNFRNQAAIQWWLHPPI